MARHTSVKRIRKNFGSIRPAISMPNMLRLQTDSFIDFLGVGQGSTDINESRLAEVFKSVFPIRDYAGNAQLDFVALEYSPPRYDLDECRRRDMTYAQGESAPDRV